MWRPHASSENGGNLHYVGKHFSETETELYCRASQCLKGAGQTTCWLSPPANWTCWHATPISAYIFKCWGAIYKYLYRLYIHTQHLYIHTYHCKTIHFSVAPVWPWNALTEVSPNICIKLLVCTLVGVPPQLWHVTLTSTYIMGFLQTCIALLLASLWQTCNQGNASHKAMPNLCRKRSLEGRLSLSNYTSASRCL